MAPHIVGTTLVLDQTVEAGGKPARHRTWRIRRDGRGGYRGTLTDATGPAVGDVEGNCLHLAFMLKGRFRTEQWLTLAADGRSAQNLMVVKKFGLRVAVLDETITKTD